MAAVVKTHYCGHVPLERNTNRVSSINTLFFPLLRSRLTTHRRETIIITLPAMTSAGIIRRWGKPPAGPACILRPSGAHRCKPVVIASVQDVGVDVGAYSSGRFVGT